MNAKLVGFKTFDFQGTDGRQVQFTKLHFICSDVEDGFNGRAVFTLNLSPNKLPVLVLDKEYELNYSMSSNGKTYLASCLPVK